VLSIYLVTGVCFESTTSELLAESASIADILIKHIDGLFSGKERVHSDVIICPLIGLTELQGHHANLACYKSDIMPPGYTRSIIWKLEVKLVKNIHIGLVVILTIVPLVAGGCSAG